jgi:hypothetical protein
MKTPFTMKESEVGAKLAEALRSLLARIPFVKIEAIDREVPADDAGRTRMDIVASLKVRQESWQLVGECKRDGQPRQVRGAMLQLKDYISRIPGESKYGLVLAPFISEESAGMCREAGVGYLDLAGNCWMSFGSVFIETRSAENPFRKRRELRSVFSPKALRILRVMLTGRIRQWKVTELAEAAGVSLGQVSNVRKQLLNREWAAVRADGIEITKPTDVLLAWQAQRARPVGRADEFFTLDKQGEFENKLAEACNRLGLRCALTELAAAARLAPMSRYLRTRAYVEDIGRVVEELKLKRVETGANVVLVQPFDSGVFYGTRPVSGVPVACPVQVYADLGSAGGRSEEAAEALLEQVIQKEWKTKTP